MPALDGMKVLDLTQYEAGTSCTQYLAWFGATVYKVEHPDRGDPGRATEGAGKDSLYFMSFNHNKKSVAINLGKPEGRELFLKMVPNVDAVVENFSLGTMEKLGIGYDVLKQINPAIIYGTIKGFGTTGPYKNFRSFDWVAQAAGGAYSVTGDADGPPVRPGATVADTGSGMHLAMGILAAYIQRLKTGTGQMVEIAMQETVANFMRMPMSRRERNPGVPVPRTGNRMVVPTAVYPCAPGGSNDHVFIMVVTSRMWDALLAGLGMVDLLMDERYATHAARLEHQDELWDTIAEWTRQRTKFEVMELLGAAGVPCSAVYDSEDILHDRHLHERNMIRTIHHPVRGDWEMLGPPIHLSDSVVEMIPAPLLGQHTGEVLAAELGLSAAEIDALAGLRVLRIEPPIPAGSAAAG